MECIAILSTPQHQASVVEEEQELVLRFQSGQADAFERIMARHQAEVARVVYRLMGSADELEDVVQDVFVCALRGLGRFRGQCKLSTWLTTIAVNQCRSRRRWRWRRLRTPWRGGRAEMDAIEDRGAVSAPAHEQVRKAVDRLPAKHREVIVLRYFEEMAVAEVAAVLGITMGAVEVRLHRARQRLKEMLGGMDEARIRPTVDAYDESGV